MAHAISDAEQLANDFTDLWTGDFSKLNVVSESFSFYCALDEVHGRDALEEHLRGENAAFPDARFQTEEIVAREDVIMLEFTWTGTHEGELDGIPPTGNTVEISGMSTLVISDGQIQEDRTYFDSREYLSQLGVTDE